MREDYHATYATLLARTSIFPIPHSLHVMHFERASEFGIAIHNEIRLYGLQIISRP